MPAHALHFAGRTDATLTDLFEHWHGLPRLRGAAAALVADLAQMVEAGDHVLFLGYVRAIDYQADAVPLLHHQGKFGAIAR